ncbi:Condensin complex subunit 1 [Nosema granulosis]|uniref:Condensin complex subunit 1 n=1 Tax=Nosema granulosis TaxID=83296 RepID=A0A9P6GY89_9MICR|nr:Condensin complex subunit 1 [Nosema granulosis]
MNVKEVIEKMKKLNIEADYEQYMQLVDVCDDFENKHAVFRIITSAPGTPTVKLPLVYSLVSKLKTQYDNKLVQDVLEYTKTQPNLTTDDYEWVAKIVFMVIENIRDKKKNDEIKLLVMENLQTCAQKIDIMSYLFNFMLNDNCGEIVYALLVFIPEICDSFVRNAIHQTNVTVLKNVAQVLGTLSGHHRSLFVNYKHFEGFLDSEHYFLRNCYLEIVSNQVEFYKEGEEMEKAVEEIEKIVGILEERLLDIYFNVRYKALNLLGGLFESNSIPIRVRNRVIESIGERVLDKTIIVRKRALAICSSILMNHPFKSETSLRKVEIENIDAVHKDINNMHKDMNEFHDVMKSVLGKVVLFLGSKVTNDLHVFMEFVKLCLYYEIEGAKEAFEMLFDFVFEGESISSCFSDVLVRLKMRKVGIYEMLKQFVKKEGNPSFERILRELWRKKVIDKDFHQEMVNKFLEDGKSPDLFVYSYLIRFIPKLLDEDTYLPILSQASSILFGVQDSGELDEALEVYCNILKVNLKATNTEALEKLVIKNLAKMVFFDYRTVQYTVQALYGMSRDPQETIPSLFKMLSSKNVNSLKIIYAVGCVGLCHLEYLEKCSRTTKNLADCSRSRIEIGEDLRERRRSIRKESINRNSINMSSINKKDILENDERADFFFFLREKDILFNRDSLLYPYAQDIPKMCLIKDLQEVAYLSLFKLMCLSSEYFLMHKPLFKNSLLHENPKIRANALVALGDFLLYYNSLVEDLSASLFEALLDSCTTVRKNALLTIFNLLKKNILRVSGMSYNLTSLLFDQTQEIRDISRTIISSLSDNQNFLTTLLYERLTVDSESSRDFIDLFIPLLRDKSKEMIYLKLLRANLEKESLEYFFSKGNFSEKFTEDLKLLQESIKT